MFGLEIQSFQKKIVLKEPFDDVCCTHGTVQTVRWPCEPIVLSIGHFEDPTEVQLNSRWKAASLWSMTAWECRLI